MSDLARPGGSSITLTGKTVYLRPLTVDDVSDTYLAWLQDDEVTKYLEARFEPQTIDGIRSWVAGFDGTSNLLFGVFAFDDDRHIGNVTLRQVRHHRTADFGYLIGDRSMWGTTAAVEALVLLFDHAFGTIGLRKLHGGAYRSNVASIFNYQRFKFAREGILRRHVLADGEPVDVIVFGLLAEEWAAQRDRHVHLVTAG
jgi:ribosomal-protein-alanine N-acetyltransferase